MRKIRELNWRRSFFMAAMSFVLVMALGLLSDRLSIVSHAQSQGKVTASSAKIRKEADGGSEVVGSAKNGASVTINHQIKASDNTVWYQIFVDADTLGYIRSDLVEITDGTTPPTGTAVKSDTGSESQNAALQPEQPATGQPQANETPAEVTAVEPLSATVKGDQPVRVRSNASTTSQIVTSAESGLALTVTGQANGTDGKVWYQVNFIADGKDVTGFIRSDYVDLSGELVPAGSNEPEPDVPEQPDVPAEEPAVSKDYDTIYEGDIWYLADRINNKKYKISEIFEMREKYEELFVSAANVQSKAKAETAAIIVLVILVVGMAGAITVLIYKIKDMKNSAYFSEVERETIRRRSGDRAAGRDQKVMHSVGADKKPTGQRTPAGQRPAGARPGGTAPMQGGQRPVGTRPGGAASSQAGQRPVGTRPGGAAPAQGGQRPAGARPGGAASSQGGQRPAGTRPEGGAAPAQGGQRPVGARPAGARPEGGAAPVQRGQRSAGTRPGAAPERETGGQQNPGWKSKNFMTDDDEFEFEFLNWDGEDDQ